jgi:membrane protein CcdC involved in cytochrome C biogenesis
MSGAAALAAPLIPHDLLMSTGLTMYVLPYADKRRSGRRAVGSE